MRHGALVRRSAVTALALLCYVLVLQSENRRQMISDDDSEPSDQSEAIIQAVDQSEARIRLTDQSESSIQAADQSEARVSRLRSVCAAQPPSPPPPGPGVETVLLPGHPPVTVCVPHKVGSHAWGEFSRRLAALYPGRMERLQSQSWSQRAAWVRRAVVVRHPLDRLVSAYRMIFQDWCDQDKFIRKKWSMCSEQGLAQARVGSSDLERVREEEGDNTVSITRVLAAVYDEYRHGQDRFIARIWYKYHPETRDQPTKDGMFKFTFREFVRFLVNGTREFADDPYILSHKGISYHWAPFHSECPVCHSLTRPDYVLHMETLEEDLTLLLDRVGLSQHRDLFPHTHTQRGGPSANMTRQLLQQLRPDEIQDLVNKYNYDTKR